MYQMTTSREQARGEGNCEGANELAQLRRTAAALLCVEPTRPDPHARWCGEGARQRASLPDSSSGLRKRRFDHVKDWSSNCESDRLSDTNQITVWIDNSKFSHAPGFGIKLVHTGDSSLWQIGLCEHFVNSIDVLYADVATC